MTWSVAIVGASGVVGGELMRLVLDHPEMSLLMAGANSLVGVDITATHPHLESYADLVGRKFEQMSPDRLVEADLVFLAVPRGESSRIAKTLPATCRIVDLGPDFRFRSSETWSNYYESEHPGYWPIGLPELHGARGIIETTERVAVPSCYATAVLLGVMPLVSANVVSLGDLIVTVMAGTSGGGRSASPVEGGHDGNSVINALNSYNMRTKHGSVPEIEQALGADGQGSMTASLVPVLAPMRRGVLAVCSVPVKHGTGQAALKDILVTAYEGEPFVKVLPGKRAPSTSAVVGSNRAVIQVDFDARAQRATVMVALDNLIKGAAGQAMQVANRMLGLPEKMGIVV